MKTPQRRQRGISLFVVMVMVLLSTLLALWASRTSLFNEMITGNDSDYQRAFEAAQAMVRDAEFDIMGSKADGTPCQSDGATYAGCRKKSSGVFFPEENTDFAAFFSMAGSSTPSCIDGICLESKVTPEFWNDKTKLAAMTATGVAASYGQFTGAKATSASNPLLLTSQAPRAWYWVEILEYVGFPTAGGKAAVAAPGPNDLPYVYRITGIANGLKPGSQAVVQSIFVWKRRNN